MKVCNDCQIPRTPEDFYVVNKRNKPTVFHICKECCSKQKKNLKSYYRNWELKKKYGITIEEYKKQCEDRKQHCDICSKVVASLHVDHNHTTGKIRGYLCGSCNRGIGLLQDNALILRRATQYLEQHD